MHIVNTITLVLLIVGGINWAIFALADADLVGSLLGGPDSALSKFVYLLVGASAIWQLIPLFRTINSNEVAAERDKPLR
jgi:uncharacterized protein